jgi:hypothetical protein
MFAEIAAGPDFSSMALLADGPPMGSHTTYRARPGAAETLEPAELRIARQVRLRPRLPLAGQPVVAHPRRGVGRSASVSRDGAELRSP